jgi:hypothetical protein
MFCGHFTEKLNSPNWVFCFWGLLFFLSLARLSLMTGDQGSDENYRGKLHWLHQNFWE